MRISYTFDDTQVMSWGGRGVAVFSLAAGRFVFSTINFKGFLEKRKRRLDFLWQEAFIGFKFVIFSLRLTITSSKGIFFRFTLFTLRSIQSFTLLCLHSRQSIGSTVVPPTGKDVPPLHVCPSN